MRFPDLCLFKHIVSKPLEQTGSTLQPLCRPAGPAIVNAIVLRRRFIVKWPRPRDATPRFLGILH
jgi:hypothetical protein